MAVGDKQTENIRRQGLVPMKEETGLKALFKVMEKEANESSLREGYTQKGSAFAYFGINPSTLLSASQRKTDMRLMSLFTDLGLLTGEKEGDNVSSLREESFTNTDLLKNQSKEAYELYIAANKFKETGQYTLTRFNKIGCQSIGNEYANSFPFQIFT
jgi:hypothetical protein